MRLARPRTEQAAMATEAGQARRAAAPFSGPLAPGWNACAAVASFCRRKPLGGLSLLIIALFVIGAIFAPLLAPYDPKRLYPGAALAGLWSHPVPGHAPFLLGGDAAGRDTFSRVLYGARIAFMVGGVATAIGVVTGTALGLVSGYIGGKLDMLLQRAVDSLMAFPALILALVIMSLLGADLRNVIIAIGVILVPITTRIVRGSVLSIKENVYIDAARAIGAGSGRIMLRHVLPNVAHSIVIVAATYLGSAILTEASLSFLGLGVPPGTPTWGNMISGAGRQYMVQHPVLLWGPAVALSLVVMSFNFLGDALRDVWDPRLRGTQR